MRTAQLIQAWFIRENKTLALAESCTGGHLSFLFVSVPGASDYFLGSLVAYSNQMKQDLLGVSEATLQKAGAVSREAAEEMLLGVFQRTSADVGVAVTGIAGPAGGSSEKPVGTVWVAMGFKGHEPQVIQLLLEGNRTEVIVKASNHILKLLLDQLSHSS